MNFWIYAIALLAVSAAVISWPLIGGTARDRIMGLFIVLIIPLGGIILYQNVGTPAAINVVAVTPQQATQEQPPHATEQGQMDALVTSLQQRMEQNPDDSEGWLILGRSLKTMQRYAEAQTALANANRLVPGNPMIMIELAEAGLFASGEPQISPEGRQLIESALAIDPDQQKGLWLMGMASAQDGDEAQAIVYWQRLLSQLDPESGGARSVTQQIEMAQTRLGQDVAPAVQAEPAASKPVTTAPAVTAPAATEPATQAPAVAGFNIPVTITIPDDLAAAIPASAALFVFIHPAGTVGMPLAVKRLAPQGFPLSLHFSDADLLRPGMSLENFEKLDISARISMSGIANANPGDYQATLVTLDTNAVAAIALNLDQRVP